MWFKKLAEQGTITKALQSKPDLYEDLFFVWESFLMLSSGRNISHMEPISFSEIEAYFNICQVPQHERIELVRWIKFIDNKFLEIKGKQVRTRLKKSTVVKSRR